jgi:hypothetical protein
MRSKLLIAAVFAGSLAGSGMAVAQIVDDPPGSLYQTQGIIESDEGVRDISSVYIRARPGGSRAAGSRLCARSTAPQGRASPPLMADGARLMS